MSPASKFSPGNAFCNYDFQPEWTISPELMFRLKRRPESQNGYYLVSASNFRLLEAVGTKKRKEIIIERRCTYDGILKAPLKK